MASKELSKCAKCGFMNPASQKLCTFCRTPVGGPVDKDSRRSATETSTRTQKRVQRPKLTRVLSDIDEVLVIGGPPAEAVEITGARADSEESERVDSGEMPKVEVTGESPQPAGTAAAKGSEPRSNQTGRLKRSSEDEILFWLACDPLDPIPVGGTGEITVGRHQTNDLVLPHKEVSRFHATFKVSMNVVSLEDLGSSNGIYVNGTKHKKSKVVVGDDVRIGPYEIMLRSTPDASTEMDQYETRCDETLFAIRADKVALSGNLEETPLTEILQGLEFNQKSGTLVVIHRSLQGRFAVVSGVPHSAQFTDVLDEQAVSRLLQLKEGHFTFTNEVPEGPGSMTSTITRLLLDESRRIDEGAGEQADAFEGFEE